VNIISNPVNSTVPIAAEVFKKAGTYDERRLFGARRCWLLLRVAFASEASWPRPGVTHLDVMRARAFLAEAMSVPPEAVDVPVIGGHAGDTILPLLSQATPPFAFTDAEVTALTTRIQNAGTEARSRAMLLPSRLCHHADRAGRPSHLAFLREQVVEAKAGAGSATLSMAAAAAEFADCCIRGLLGEPGVVACAYVASSLTDLPFFASKCVRAAPQIALTLACMRG
jgi:malate dehydrogenase